MDNVMIEFTEVINKINTFKDNYRRDDIPDLRISKIYSLFPSGETNQLKWPAPWPFAFEKGVYLIFGSNMELLYVGKASMQHNIGGRLSSYFRYNDDKTGCKIVHNGWITPPRFVVTVAVPEDMAFEAPALEEYLISSLNPPENKKGSMKENANH